MLIQFIIAVVLDIIIIYLVRLTLSKTKWFKHFVSLAWVLATIHILLSLQRFVIFPMEDIELVQNTDMLRFVWETWVLLTFIYAIWDLLYSKWLIWKRLSD
jgi:hypothetical protein